MFKLFPVAVEVAKADAGTPVLLQKRTYQIRHKAYKVRTGTYSGSECELEIVGSEGVVFNSGFDDFLEEFIVAEEVLCNA
jgi:hypothetical protein